MCKIRPAGYRVLVELDTVEEKTESGIILKASGVTRRDQAMQEDAIVVAIGPTAFHAYDDGQPWCKVGDKVRIVRYSGNTIEDDETGKMFSIINDEDIVGVYAD